MPESNSVLAAAMAAAVLSIVAAAVMFRFFRHVSAGWTGSSQRYPGEPCLSSVRTGHRLAALVDAADPPALAVQAADNQAAAGQARAGPATSGAAPAGPATADRPVAARVVAAPVLGVQAVAVPAIVGRARATSSHRNGVRSLINR